MSERRPEPDLDRVRQALRDHDSRRDDEAEERDDDERDDAAEPDEED